MKIGIITLYGQTNYGNRLQNYAVSKLLQKYGEPETIVIQYENVIKEKIRKWFLYKHGIAFRHKVPHRISKAARERCLRFVQFTDENIPFRYYKASSFLHNRILQERFESFVTGSDQVWNPFFWGEREAENMFALYLLAFSPGEKRIALSASIGIDTLPEKWSGRFSQEWKKFRAISVREDRGAEIIRECCGRDVPVLLDPTLSLSKEEWMSVMDSNVSLPERYALVCFLGEMTDAYQNMIRTIIQEWGLNCVELNKEEYPEYYQFGPAGFLTAVERAEIIFTDSFHAVVFSIIFEKPFIVFDRIEKDVQSMYSRIETLLEKMGLQNRVYSRMEAYGRKWPDLFSCDYESVKQRLKREQEKMEEYLDALFLSKEGISVV